MHSKSGESLGTFDFHVSSDKTSALRYRNDLDQELLRDFVKPASFSPSAPSLALMVASDPAHLGFASLLLEGHPEFSWMARDDTKPGRERSDGAECWIAHASPAFAKRLLDSYKKGGGSTASSNAIRAAIVRDLVPSFVALVGTLGGAAHLNVHMAQGHRWGAAFPVASFPGSPSNFYLDPENAFAACGDYYTAFPISGSC
ncbi:hypothetical protein T492DRAFT_849095 [Pavlovales sp. CCMP2436]|nr:hypothetical protein T492DRAFT_849095 [Pavlovales sp. CCMP2436]